MERKDVYELIDGEREFQDAVWDAKMDRALSVADWVIFMEQRLADAKSHVYGLREYKVLDEIRKIAALAVACMEHNETFARQATEPAKELRHGTRARKMR